MSDPRHTKTSQESGQEISPEKQESGPLNLDAIHAELLEQLRDITAVCDRHDIPYNMMCGSLLGTVRHKGFIPWDDDVDLLMTREAFTRFREVYPKECDKRFELTYLNTWTPRVMNRDPEKAAAFTDLFILDHVPPEGFVKLRLKLEAERQRLRAERNRRSREAYQGPVSQKELEQAVKAPDLAGREAEYYVRIKHKDEAAAAFDREQENNPVLNYFRTADYLAEELNRLRMLAPMPGLEFTDFSADRKKFEEACERLAKLERELMQNPSFK